MNITKLIEYCKKPSLYENGSAIMWTDPHISRKLLEFHINSNIDAASRNHEKINLIIEWILSETEHKQNLDVLDLGCGPGLYSEKLAKTGHNVTGIDFSKGSIEYAQNISNHNQSDINYICQNYLDISYENEFDLIILIYLDFCVLKPQERERLVKIVHKALKPGGVFIFDVVNENNINEKILPQSFEMEEEGFWKNEPYIVFNKGYHFPESKALLNQHIVVDQNDRIESYLFWSTYYNFDDLQNILGSFESLKNKENLLPEGDVWNGENITFYKAVK